MSIPDTESVLFTVEEAEETNPASVERPAAPKVEEAERCPATVSGAEMVEDDCASIPPAKFDTSELDVAEKNVAVTLRPTTFPSTERAAPGVLVPIPTAPCGMFGVPLALMERIGVFDADVEEANERAFTMEGRVMVAVLPNASTDDTAELEAKYTFCASSATSPPTESVYVGVEEAIPKRLFVLSTERRLNEESLLASE